MHFFGADRRCNSLNYAKADRPESWIVGLGAKGLQPPAVMLRATHRKQRQMVVGIAICRGAKHCQELLRAAAINGSQMTYLTNGNATAFMPRG